MGPEILLKTASAYRAIRPCRKKYFQKSDIFLIGAAFISFVLSVSLWFYGYKDEGLFVGLWVPSILSFGCYFKQMLNK